MRVLISFIRQYPAQCLIVWVCLVAAGLGEGLTLTTLLPMLTMTKGGGNAGGMGDSGAAHMLSNTLGFFSLAPTLGVLVGLVVLGLLVKAVLTLLAYRQVGYTVAMIATDLRLTFLRALSGSRWEYFLRQRSGGLANTVSTEATRSASAFQNGANLLAMLSQACVFFGVALLVNWRAALLTLVPGIGIFSLLRGFIGMSRRAGNRQSKMFKSLLSLLTDSLQSLKPLKSMAREAEMDALLERQTQKLNKAMRKQVLSAEALKSIQELLIGLIMVIGVVVTLVVWQMQLAEVMVLLIVLARMLTKLSKLQQGYQKLVVSESFYWSMQTAIEQAQAAREQPFGSQAPTLEQGIEFQRVEFGYGEHSVLHDIDMTIPAGQCTALIGFSGAGKTTLVDLIIGLLRADAGQVRIDGVPIDCIDIRRWRAMIGYVPQDTVLLHDTILANVAVGNPDIDEAQAIWALRKAGAWDFVRRLPEGLQTSVGEHGARFSGGQRQRIVIARALAHRPKLLILDEATSALDPQTERAVSDTLRALGAQYTILSISHRASLTDLADRVYKIEQGRAALTDPAASAAEQIA